MTPEDRALLAELRRLSGSVDPVPEHVLAAAAAAGQLLSADWDWLDTLADNGMLVRAGTSRQLSFGRDGHAVLELELRGADRLVLVGLVDLVDLLGAVVEVRWATGAVTAPLDDAGCFRVAGLPRVPVRIVVLRLDARPLATRWLLP